MAGEHRDDGRRADDGDRALGCLRVRRQRSTRSRSCGHGRTSLRWCWRPCWVFRSQPWRTDSWRWLPRSRTTSSAICHTSFSGAMSRPGGRCRGSDLPGLLTGLTIRYLPGNAGHSPAFGFKTGGGPPKRQRARWGGARRPEHAQPRRCPRSRGSADRYRRRPRCLDGAPGEEGRSADSGDGDGVGGQFRRDQHAARVTGPRRVPHHGSRGDRRRDAQPGRAARTPRLRHRGVGVRRPRQLDRPGQLLPRPAHRCRRRSRRRLPRCAGRSPWEQLRHSWSG